MAAWMIAFSAQSVRSFSFRSQKSSMVLSASTIRIQQQQKMKLHNQSFSSSFVPGGFRIVSKQHHTRRSYGISSLTMMPEGPEVRSLVDKLRIGIGKRLVDIRFLSGRYLRQRPVGFSDFATTMTPLKQPPPNISSPGHDNDLRENDNNDESSSSNSNNNEMAETTGNSIDTILDWNCKGKFIYMILDDGAAQKKTPSKNEIDDSNSNTSDDDDDDFQRSIWITLGMTGRFVNEAKHLEDPSHGRWVLELVDETKNNHNHKIYYHDKRNFGTVKFCLSKSDLHQKLTTLGPDILAMARQQARIENVDDPSVTIDDELQAKNSEAEFLRLMETQRNPQFNVCKFLMNQTKIAGVGNYILSEALYRSNIDPFCGIDELSTPQRILLFDQIKGVSIESYRSQRESSGAEISTGYTSVRELEPFEFQLQVYGNQGSCPKGNPVIRETNGPHGRTIWYTEQQLFVSRNVRQVRERKLQELQQPQQQQRQQPKVSTKDNEPWTITRRDGVDLLGAGNNHHEERDAEENPPPAAAEWNILDGLTEQGWKEALEPYVASSESFANLQDFLKDEYSSFGRDQIYPPPHQVFSALNLCPLENVKVVILGQDPYHGPNQSTGLAFSVSKKISKIPPSLRNIFRELDDDVGSTLPSIPEIRHGDLEGWARQGVLMLNTVLTVRRGQANSHQKKGWEDFTDEIVRILRDRAATNSGSGVVFLLWGGPASKKAKSIVASGNTHHVVLTTSHPSPLGATKTASPFLTSRCFSRANAALEELEEEPIDWYNR